MEGKIGSGLSRLQRQELALFRLERLGVFGEGIALFKGLPAGIHIGFRAEPNSIPQLAGQKPIEHSPL